MHLEKNTLTISGTRKEESENQNAAYTRIEHAVRSFKRSFTVSENVDGDGISAQYVNGVLTLNLPKKTEVKPSAKQISVQ